MIARTYEARIAGRDNLASPHQDRSVLHAPGTCTQCDEFPAWQAHRVKYKLNFTGEPGVVNQPRGGR